MTEIISRKEAGILGSLYYFTGKPCKNGHFSKRSYKYKKCILCNRERARKYYKIRAQNRAAARLERANNYGCKYGHSVEFYTKGRGCKICHRESCKRWYRKNRDKNIKKRILYNRANPEKAKKNTARYKANNPETFRAQWQRRRARMKQAIGFFTGGQIKDMFAKQGMRCANCLRSITLDNMHRDHIVPLSRGGTNYIENIQLLCAPCNQSKGALTQSEFVEKQRRAECHII